MAKKTKAATPDAVALIKEINDRAQSFKAQHGINQEGLYWLQDKLQELHDALVPEEAEKEEEAEK